jgi:hypothetical protein
MMDVAVRAASARGARCALGRGCAFNNCAYPVIEIQERNSIIAQTKLHLDGTQSVTPNGPLSYQWTVQQPVGSQTVFFPHANSPQPTFEANVAGTYTFGLETTSGNELGTCKTAQYTVNVTADQAIHIELLWDTPNDPDQTDEGPEAGADLDLHLLHPYAGGPDIDGDGEPDGWFDQPFDCFWFNDQPNWSSLNPLIDDDPSLDRDDTDGAGPENVNRNGPINGDTYRIGAHYWNDHRFGPSLVTIRV